MLAGTAVAGGALVAAGDGDPKLNPRLGLVLDELRLGMLAGTAGTEGALVAAGDGDSEPSPWLGLMLDGKGKAAGATLALGEKENPGVVVLLEPKAGSDEGNFSCFSGLAGDIGS